jgi:hypothetical protein
MTFVRFIVSQPHPDSGVEQGLLGAAYALSRSDETSETERAALQELIRWFEEHLPAPARFNRSSSKGHYRRASKGIAWFRDTAALHIARMHELKRLVEASGVPVTIVTGQRIGYVVFEDEFQVIAEPFADTRTGA